MLKNEEAPQSACASEFFFSFRNQSLFLVYIHTYIHIYTIGRRGRKKGEKDRCDPLFPEREFQRDERVMARATPAIQAKEPDVEESQERERVLAR